MRSAAARYDSRREDPVDAMINAMLDQVEACARTLIEHGAEVPLRARMQRVLEGRQPVQTALPLPPPPLPEPANDTTELALRFANALGALRSIRKRDTTQGARMLALQELRKARTP